MTKAMYLYLLIFPVFTPAYYSCFHSPWVLSLKNMFRLISNIYLYIPNEINVKVLCHATCTLGILTRYNTLSYYTLKTEYDIIHLNLFINFSGIRNRNLPPTGFVSNDLLSHARR